MLNKKNRISNRRLIQKLLNKGGLYKNAYFLFKYLPSTEENSQFAFVISKKVSPKAVERNKLKRQISDSVKSHLDSIKENIAVTIIVKPGILDKNPKYEDIDNYIKDFLNNIK